MLLVYSFMIPRSNVTSELVSMLALLSYPVKMLQEVKREVVGMLSPRFCRASLYYEKLVLLIGAQREVHYDMSALW